jgi:[ribosomal protein S5]-alanine N-acetyltransferase
VDVPPILSERLALVSAGPEAIEALLEGRRAAAAALVGTAVPPDWPDGAFASFLRLRLGQLRSEPAAQPWLVRLLVERAEPRRLVGHGGFHGPPGVNALSAADAVELGYALFPEFRGRGYATEAVAALIAWASEEHGLRRFVASVSPTNEPSLALVRRLGFVHVGEHWDEEDGRELEFELRLPALP